jgi:hypothetical protein
MAAEGVRASLDVIEAGATVKLIPKNIEEFISNNNNMSYIIAERSKSQYDIDNIPAYPLGLLRLPDKNVMELIEISGARKSAIFSKTQLCSRYGRVFHWIKDWEPNGYEKMAKKKLKKMVRMASYLKEAMSIIKNYGSYEMVYSVWEVVPEIIHRDETEIIKFWVSLKINIFLDSGSILSGKGTRIPDLSDVESITYTASYSKEGDYVYES